MTDLLEQPGKCRGCGSEVYTRRELNLHDGQHWLCYRCFDEARGRAPIVPAARRYASGGVVKGAPAYRVGEHCCHYPPPKRGR